MMNRIVKAKRACPLVGLSETLLLLEVGVAVDMFTFLWLP